MDWALPLDRKISLIKCNNDPGVNCCSAKLFDWLKGVNFNVEQNSLLMKISSTLCSGTE